MPVLGRDGIRAAASTHDIAQRLMVGQRMPRVKGKQLIEVLHTPLGTIGILWRHDNTANRPGTYGLSFSDHSTDASSTGIFARWVHSWIFTSHSAGCLLKNSTIVSRSAE